MKSLAYTSAYMVPFTAVFGATMGGFWTFLTPVFFFVMTPIVDEILPHDDSVPSKEEESERLANKTYDAVLSGYVLLQVLSLAFGLWMVTAFAHSALEWVGMILSFGIIGGAGINVAHELMHRSNGRQRALGEVLMTSVSYTHFCIEHVYGHHRKVATHEDAATSRLGESVYGFIPRSVIGSFRSFLEIEKTLAARKKLSPFSLRDRRVRYALVWLALVSTVFVYGGWSTLGFFLGQSVVAFCMLEVVNYLEHYGLERVELAPGRYQVVQPEHSWNSPHRLTGWFLFGLPKHSDHHHKCNKQYPILRHHDDAPQLPAGYGSMFLLALVPPVWRAVMDPRVHEVRRRSVEQVPRRARRNLRSATAA